MRRRSPVLVAIALAATVSSVAFAPGVTELASPAATAVTGDPGPGYFATSNVEWLGMIPFSSGSAGARVHEDRLYVTDQFGFTIYDLANPELPTPISFTPSPQQYYFTEEDVDTNWEILIVGSFGEVTPDQLPLNTIFVYDVSDPTPSATLLGSLSSVGADQHTMTCVLDCTYVLGSGGAVVDLTDPTSPTLVGDWSVDPDLNAVGVDGSHDLTEVRPGLVMISSNPVVWADFTNPVDPAVLSTGPLPDSRFIHGNLWPNEGTDELVLVGGENGGDCDIDDGAAFMTFRAPDVEVEGATLELLDEYRVGTGIYTDGDSPYNQFCAHWFTTEPEFRNGGLVAAAWYEHGTRFLDVASDGTISERGWFVPLGGSQSAAYFVTDDIVLTTDYQRGVDILRINRDAPAISGEAEGDLVMVGQAAAVAAGTVDPNSFFPWFGNEDLVGPAPSGIDAFGRFVCPLPIRL